MADDLGDDGDRDAVGEQHERSGVPQHVLAGVDQELAGDLSRASSVLARIRVRSGWCGSIWFSRAPVRTRSRPGAVPLMLHLTWRAKVDGAVTSQRLDISGQMATGSPSRGSGAARTHARSPCQEARCQLPERLSPHHSLFSVLLTNSR